MFCRSCGKEIPDDALRCPACGAVLRDMTAPPPSPAAMQRDPQGMPRPQTVTAARPPVPPMPYPAPRRRGAAFVGRIVFCLLGMALGIAVVVFALRSGRFDVPADFGEAASETGSSGITAYLDAALRPAVEEIDRVVDSTVETLRTVALAAKVMLTLTGGTVALFFSYLLCTTLDRRD